MLEKVKFVSFAIIAKRKYVNSVLVGSKHEISNKLNISDYHARKLINYGIKHRLIEVLPNGFQIAPYSELITHLQLPFDNKHLSLHRFGSFEDLVKINLYKIFRNNLITQEFNIKKAQKLETIKQLLESDKTLTKVQYNFYNKNKTTALRKKNIVTGQKHISKILQISQGFAYSLMNEWSKMRLFFIETIYTNKFEYFSKNVLKLEVGLSVCLGTRINSYM